MEGRRDHIAVRPWLAAVVSMRPNRNCLLVAAASIVLASSQFCDAASEYFGRYIGPMSRLLHSVSGEVYAVDARTLHIRDFTYDGEGPAAFFYAGNSKAPGPGGFIVRDETGSNGVLKRYNKKHITLTLPEGKTLNNIRWFSVWCEEFQVNFGDVQISRALDFPKPQKVGALSGVHGVASDNIVVVDAQTLLIPSFSYDGEAPDAKFWVGRGPKPSPQGIRVPDENGKQNPLRRYDRKTIVLTLPGELTVFDIGHFGVWCEAFTVDFGHVQIPPALNVPPSLKMLGVSPQKRSLQSALQQFILKDSKRSEQAQLQESQQVQVQDSPQQEPPVGYQQVLPLFNVQNIKPTTFRPPIAHRFAAPRLTIPEALPQPSQPTQQPQPQTDVEIQASVTLTPEPLVLSQPFVVAPNYYSGWAPHSYIPSQQPYLATFPPQALQYQAQAPQYQPQAPQYQPQALQYQPQESYRSASHRRAYNSFPLY
ncbi:DM13 and DOMON_DOH domain-containing protein skeletor isoform X2 [Rhodnius prolixus]|uniref:DM13 and DOMON_DOH domain-containing protein skeletor isoform X2 n=1 Tax=Rhodnius prolixus TaxID=13249 RepID=UPI003D18C885